MSGITLTEVDDATIATPASGKATVFMDDTLGPAYKDDAGAVHSLQGEEGELTYLNHGNTGASEDIDVSAADIHRLVFNAATVTITFSNWPASGTPGIVRTYIVQDGSGGRLASWPGAVTWGAAGAPTLQTGAAAIDIIDFQSVDGGTTILGSYEAFSSASPNFTTIELGHASDTTLARASAGNVTIEGKAVYRADGTDVALADGGTGASLSDPNADRIMFWDDSAGAVTWLTAGTNLTITATTIDASGGSSTHSAAIDYDLGADVAVASANTYTDAASGTPAAGTYDIFWKVTCTANGSTATGFKCQLLTGATEIDYSEGYTFANERTTLQGFAFDVVLDGSTVVKTRMRGNQTNTTISRDGGNGANHDATKISLRKTH